MSVLAPVHPHPMRRARVRQIVRQTKGLPLARKQAGQGRLRPAYLTLGGEASREVMRQVAE